MSKCPSAVGNKRILQFFHSARALRTQVIALVDSKSVFLLLSFYIFMSFIFIEFYLNQEKKNLAFYKRERL